MTIEYTPKVGDYVVHSELTIEEYTKFHDAAIAAGYTAYLNETIREHWNSGRWRATALDDEYEIVLTNGSCEDSKNNVTHLFKQQKHFTKADLRNGMLVEYRDGNVRMVWAEDLFAYTRLDDSYHRLSRYTDNLVNNAKQECLDIMAVYEHAGATPSDFTKGKLIWQREVPQIKPKTKVTLELTDEQLEKIKQVIGE